MINAIIRGTLGTAGNAILDFYLANAMWINGIFLIYALIVLLGKLSVNKLDRALKEKLIQEHGEDVRGKNASWYKKTFTRQELDWAWLSHQSRIPLLSTKGSVVFKIKNMENLRAIYTPERMAGLFDDSDA